MLNWTNMERLLKEFQEIVQHGNYVQIPGIVGDLPPDMIDGTTWFHHPGDLGEPRNNDGRNTCWWCGIKTKKVQGFTSEYDICPKCEK